jgi:hypothetical protein
MLTGVPPFEVPVLGVIDVTVGGGLEEPCPLARKVAICMTQVEEERRVAGAL